MYKTLLLALVTSFSTGAYAQNNPGKALGGNYIFNREKLDCINSTQRLEIFKTLARKKDSLAAKGRLITKNALSNPLFIWPVRQAEGFGYNDVWSISNYVDHNTAYPNQVADYNCGQRSYDTDSGYNHTGVDIFTWPFTWHQMENNQTEVVAAAPGQVIYKSDGNFDQSCSFNNNNWNAIYIMHTDGSIAWYGHMKSNSLTSKQVGDMVEAGEFLGVVGSSGNSTGPHLHFEVYDANQNLIDPYAGTCNPLNQESWWAEQKPYRNPRINAVFTHSAPPEFNTCPEVETTHISNQFETGDLIYAAVYLRDQDPQSTMDLALIRPDNTYLYSWSDVLVEDYYSSYWYWTIQPDMDGEWMWQVTYQGETVSYNFTVGTMGSKDNSLSATNIYPNPAGNTVFINSDTTIVNAVLYDTLGKKVFEEKNEAGIKELDIAFLAKGIYHLTLYTADNTAKTVKLAHQ